MATHKFTLCFVLFGPATAIAQTVAAPETWIPVSQNAKAITGTLTFSPREITFQNGSSLSLAPAGQALFRSEAKKKRVMANLYRITPPADPLLQNGTRLCNGKPVAYLIAWKSEEAGHEAGRGLAPFSGPQTTAGSPDDCGHYAYTAK